MTCSNEVHSDLPIPSGEYLKEVIAELGMSHAAFGLAVGLTENELNDLLVGKLQMDEALSGKIEKATGVGSHICLGLEREFRLTQKLSGV